jgi:integrase
MSDKRFSFSKNLLDKLPLPEKGRRVYYYDSKTRGLALAVSGTGNKTFVLYRKVRGKPERLTLGHYPEIGVEQARGLASEANAAIAQGKNPGDQRRKVRDEWTLDALFSQYLEHHAKPHKRSWEEDQAQYRRYLQQEWGKRKLSGLHRAELQALHTRLGQAHGPYAANRLLALLRSLFGKAAEWGWEGGNPADGIKQFSEKARERFLQADELPRLFAALAEENNPAMRDYVLLSLLTGARKTNVLSMRWQDVHLERQTWQIPRTKNGTPQTVPLVAEALAILGKRRANAGDSEFVFPGSGKRGHLVEPKKAWQRILERAGLENLRLHDLRRSLGSWQAATGANLAVIGKTLNHKDMKSTAIYARLNLEPVRAAMETATQAMWEAAEEKSPDG